MAVGRARGLAVIDLPAGTLLIADLHLDGVGGQGAGDAGSGEANSLYFRSWLAANPAPSLVILGDLFDAWIGVGQARLPAARIVLEALRDVFPGAVHLVPGNRDFLFDGEMGQPFGIAVHRDGALGRLPDGGRVLLVHGDEFCTEDRPYQRLKRVLRSLEWLLRLMPMALCLGLARRLRRRSTLAVVAKPAARTAMQPAACRGAARAAGAREVVCGHAHLAAVQPLGEAGEGRWWVLGAFGSGAGSGADTGAGAACLRVTESGFEPLARNPR